MDMVLTLQVPNFKDIFPHLEHHEVLTMVAMRILTDNIPQYKCSVYIMRTSVHDATITYFGAAEAIRELENQLDAGSGTPDVNILNSAIVERS